MVIPRKMQLTKTDVKKTENMKNCYLQNKLNL